MDTTLMTPRWIFLGGFLAALLVFASLKALFSGRVLAVLFGLVGTLSLVGGGLVLLGALIFNQRSASVVARVAVPDGGRVEVAGPPGSKSPWPLSAEAPEILSDDPSYDSSTAPTPPIEKSDAPAVGAPRPAWMDGQMGRVGDIYRTTVKVGPTFSRTECEKQLPAMLHEAVQTYADHLLGEDRGRFARLPAAYVQNHLVRGEWEEQRETTYDTMIILHELLEFDREANEAIEANYRQSVVLDRLAYTATGGGVVLGLLTILFGYLKLDTLTRGS